jgi:hypothetical protein
MKRTNFEKLKLIADTKGSKIKLLQENYTIKIETGDNIYIIYIISFLIIGAIFYLINKGQTSFAIISILYIFIHLYLDKKALVISREIILETKKRIITINEYSFLSFRHKPILKTEFSNIENIIVNKYILTRHGIKKYTEGDTDIQYAVLYLKTKDSKIKLLNLPIGPYIKVDYELFVDTLMKIIK